MRLFTFTCTIFLLLLAACTSTNKAITEAPGSETIPLFREVSSDSSGITFANELTHDVATKANLFDFDYFYNGAGVGIVDINNDGLEDIFFCGNQVGNRLYLNKGDLKFEDISEKANINEGKFWANGVTFADINNDGYQDIYVSQGGPHEAHERKNTLYINNGDLTFTESAESFGLDDPGLSTQSAFFDYDNDGDLDCVVMNESEFYGMEPIKFHQLLLTNLELLKKNSSHLYEQQNGVFVDVTREAGLLRPSFGLGLVISDINEDGWLDIYMANDYYIPDFMLINQKNKTFSDEMKARTTQLSFFGMGADINDLNNDCKQEIFVLDMASADHIRSKTLMASMSTDNFDLLTRSLEFPYQYMFNSLQLNLGNNRFRNIAHYTGVAKTDWSWAVLMNDLDNNGLKDIFITNGYRRYALDNDFKNQVLKVQEEYNYEVPVEVKAVLYDSMPSESLPNLLYMNKGNLSFREVADENSLGAPSFSNGGAVADLDNDGDLEIVVNNIDQEAFLYENLSNKRRASNYLKVETRGSLSEEFAKIYIYHGGITQSQESKRVRGYFSSVSPIAHFGVGYADRIDSVVVHWPASGRMEKRYNIKANQTLLFEEKNSISATLNNEPLVTPLEQVSVGKLKLFYKHTENLYNDFEKEILLPYKQSTLGPRISRSVENSSDEFVYVSGARGQAGRLFKWDGERFTKLDVSDFEQDTEYEDMAAVFLDIDNDGDQDMYIVSGGNSLPPESEYYQDRVYINDDNTFKRSYAALPDAMQVSGKSAIAMDFDQDGDQDLIVGNRIIPQSYPMAGSNQILENQQGVLVDVTSKVAPGFGDFGITNKVIKTDFDGDGAIDFIAVGEWTGIGMFRNTNGSFTNVVAEYDLDKLTGLWFDVEEVELNGDGRPDYVLGNIGLNTKFKTSKEKPFKLFAHDFDTNGTLDIVLSSTYKDEYVPVRGRECSSQQMPFISEKYETYEDFANATVYDIFDEQIDSSLKYEATTFASMALVSNNDGFTIGKLPIEAQLFPIMACEQADINNDGIEEVFVVGNIYNTEVETPRWDAGTGALISVGRKPGGKIDLNGKTLDMQGNIKDIEIFKDENGQHYIIAAKNNDLMSVYRLRNDY